MLSSFFYAFLRLVDGLSALSAFVLMSVCLLMTVVYLTDIGKWEHSALNHMAAYINTVTLKNVTEPRRILSLNFFVVLLLTFCYNALAFGILSYILVKGKRDYIHKLNDGVDPYKWILIGSDLGFNSFITTVTGVNVSMDSWIWNPVTSVMIPIILFYMDKLIVDQDRQKKMYLMIVAVLLVQLILTIMHFTVRNQDVSISSTIWFLNIFYFIYAFGITVTSYLRNTNTIDKLSADVGLVIGSTVYRTISSSLILSMVT